MWDVIIDVHCHYTLSSRRADESIERFSFEPACEDGRANFDSFVAPRATGRLTWQLLGRLLGVRGPLEPGPSLDAQLEAFYERHLLSAGPIERFVLLAFDRYHDRQGGRPPPPVDADDLGSDIYTSNSLVRSLCRQHPQRFLFGASVHPYRRDAVACVQEVFSAGACLLKWLPLHQNIDVTDPRSLRVLRCCAQLGLPLLVHYGEEFTLATQHPEYLSIEPLLEVLRQLRREGTMPTVIVAHVSTPVWALGDAVPYRRLTEALLGEFADAPLYADISALTAWGKPRFLRQIVRRQELHGKLLFGTDFPVPVGLPRLRGWLGPDYGAIAREPSWPQRVARIDRCLGFQEIVFHRAADVLPNVR